MSTDINENHHGLKSVEFADAKLKGEHDKKLGAEDGKKLTVSDYLEEKRRMPFDQGHEHQGKGEDHIMEWYKGKFALNYFTTGSIDKNDIQTLALDFEFTEEQVDKIYSVIDEIGEELVNGIGMAVVMRLLRCDDWIEGKQDRLPEFETRDDRIKWFRQSFYDHPILVVYIVHTISPALDLRWIMESELYSGENEWYNTLRIRLRYHIFTRCALIADVLFKGMLHVTDAAEIGNDPERTKKMLHKCLRRNPITDAKYGDIAMSDWPIKQPYDPDEDPVPWHTWCADWPGVGQPQEHFDSNESKEEANENE